MNHMNHKNHICSEATSESIRLLCSRANSQSAYPQVQETEANSPTLPLSIDPVLDDQLRFAAVSELSIAWVGVWNQNWGVSNNQSWQLSICIKPSISMIPPDLSYMFYNDRNCTMES